MRRHEICAKKIRLCFFHLDFGRKLKDTAPVIICLIKYIIQPNASLTPFFDLT